jgi:hypothetical protein
VLRIRDDFIPDQTFIPDTNLTIKERGSKYGLPVFKPTYFVT